MDFSLIPASQSCQLVSVAVRIPVQYFRACVREVMLPAPHGSIHVKCRQVVPLMSSSHRGVVLITALYTKTHETTTWPLHCHTSCCAWPPGAGRSLPRHGYRLANQGVDAIWWTTVPRLSPAHSPGESPVGLGVTGGKLQLAGGERGGPLSWSMRPVAETGARLGRESLLLPGRGGDHR